jgi:acetylornithine deacetylase/succinyl-diaminopimelate desuccinylase-like protein
VFRRIDAEFEDHLRLIQEYLRQPSVSATGEGIADCAEMTRQYLQRLGCQETELIATDGHPGVWGSLDEGADRTLVVYWMYDTSPANPSEWSSPPFEARVVSDTRFGPTGKVLFGRGALDAKGCERAFLNAIEAARAVLGRLPVNLLFLCDGEEELGSPHLSQLVASRREQLQEAHGVVFPMVCQELSGRARMQLGGKGIVTLRLTTRGGANGGPRSRPVHSMSKAAVDSPVWRLVQALATLTDATGNEARIGGFRDRIRPLTQTEGELLTSLADVVDVEGLMTEFDVERWIGGADTPVMLRRLLFEPSVNIGGISGGSLGANVVPHEASARLDVRLVPDQRAADVLPLVRQHLDQQGFGHVEVVQIGGYDAWQTSFDSIVVRAASMTYRAFDVEPVAWPLYPGSAPFYLFTRDLGLPLLRFGAGYGANFHGPDEFLVIESQSPIMGLTDMEKAYADFVLRFAEV